MTINNLKMVRAFLSFLTIFLFLVLFYQCGKPDDEDLKVEMLKRINELRQSGCLCGEDSMPVVHELLWDESLEVAALAHVRDISESDNLSHYGSDGSTPNIRAVVAGFEGAFVGENIARGYINADAVMKQWINSTNHCKTIMDDHYYFVAAAYQDYYWVQMFGSN